MSNLRSLPALIAVAALLAAGHAPRAEGQPQLLPTRDVDITYEVTRPVQSAIRERVRWLASEHLERIDGPDKSTTIFDRRTHEITLLTPAGRTYRKLEGSPRWAFEPEPGAVLERGAQSAVAGLSCVDWSWIEDNETRTLCATPDGVLLRLVVDGRTIIEARAISYAPQTAELFEVPPDYSPAIAPDGALD
jgi:hypothetical protein